MKRDQDEIGERTMDKMSFQSNKKIKVSQNDNVSYHHDTNVMKNSSSHNNKSPSISSTKMMPVKLDYAMPIGNVSASSNKLKEVGNNCSKNRSDLDRANVAMTEKKQVKLSHSSSTCVPASLLPGVNTAVSKATLLSNLTSTATTVPVYHSSSSSQPEVVSINLASVSGSGVKKGTGMTATTAKKMMGTTGNKPLNVLDHHDSIQKKQYHQQSNANGKQEMVIDVDQPKKRNEHEFGEDYQDITRSKHEQVKVQEKMVRGGEVQSITNNNTAASQASNRTSSTFIPCKSPAKPPSNMTYPLPDPLVTEAVEGIFNLVQQYGPLTIEQIEYNLPSILPPRLIPTSTTNLNTNAKAAISSSTSSSTNNNNIQQQTSMQLDKRKLFQVLEVMTITGALKKTIDNVKDNCGVDSMAEKDEIKNNEKNMREERKIQSVKDVAGRGMILNKEGDESTTLGRVSSSTKWKSISSELTEDDLGIKNIAKDNESSTKTVEKEVGNNQGGVDSCNLQNINKKISDNDHNALADKGASIDLTISASRTRYFFGDGIQRAPGDIVRPCNLLSYISDANKEIDGSTKRIEILRRVLLGKTVTSDTTNHNKERVDEVVEENRSIDSTKANDVTSKKVIAGNMDSSFNSDSAIVEEIIKKKAFPLPPSISSQSHDGRTCDQQRQVHQHPCDNKRNVKLPPPPSGHARRAQVKAALSSILSEFPDIVDDPVYAAALTDLDISSD